MTSTQDCSIGIVPEVTYKTPVTVSRWYEYTDESLDYRKNVKQGLGLRVGGRVARSGKRVVPTTDGGGDFTLEVCAKGMGLLLQACMGAGVSTVVSAATYQENFTLGDSPFAFTLQKGLPEAGGTVDAYTFAGCVVSQFDLNFPNADIVTLKTTVDAAALATATSYAAPSYATQPNNLFHFAGGAITTGTFTAPTTTALASSVTTLANVRGGALSVNHNIKGDRYNLGGAGQKTKPTNGLRTITGNIDVEYTDSTFRDAYLADTPMSLVLTWSGAALGVGLETLQIAIPEIKLDGELAKTNGTDLIIQPLKFTGLDNLVAAAPLYISMRTADAAL